MYKFCLLFFLAIWLFSCNSNSVTVIPQDPTPPPLLPPINDSISLPPITNSQIMTTFSTDQRQTLRLTTANTQNNIGDFYFYTSHDITSIHVNIKNIIFMIHGLSASDDALQSEYNSIFSAVNQASRSGSTVIIAPYFNHRGIGNEIDWDNAVWRAGGRASSPDGITLGSFQIIDYMLSYFLFNNFSNLTNIVITGHSAGGQFAQRYAALNDLDSLSSPYTFTYLPANPSHYLYMNALRWNGASTYSPTDCSTYNNYPYGFEALTLDNRYAFIEVFNIQNIINQYINRNVYYVLGSIDTINATSGCEPENQEGGSGENRFQRGIYINAYMNNQYPDNNHDLLVIDGVGHNPNGIYNASAYIQLLETLLD